MHDWTLKEIKYSWLDDNCVIEVINSYQIVRNIKVIGISNISIPRNESWGPSNSIYKATVTKASKQELTIEMQSGDTIAIVAEKIIMP